MGGVLFAAVRLSLIAFLLLGSWSFAAQIPFEYRDGLIWVKVKAAGSRESLNFLLDSGAGSSVLDLATARRLGVVFGGAVKVQRVDKATPAYRVSGFSANVGGVTLQSNPLAVDLSDTSALCSRRIDGLIGYDFFRDRVVQIDFEARCIRMLAETGATASDVNIPLKVRNGALCVPVSLNGARPQWTRLDTGYDGALRWVDGVGGDDMRTSIAIGEEQLANVLTAMCRSAMFPSEAGLLGNLILSKYRITIDAVKGRLLLKRS